MNKYKRIKSHSTVLATEISLYAIFIELR